MFKNFKDAVAGQFKAMAEHELFTVDVDKDQLWETYLSSFPEGSNPQYIERTEHDCSACRQFVKAAGSVVALVDNQMVSIWDVNLDGHYGVVAKAMAAFVKSKPIANVFRYTEPSVGIDCNHQRKPDDEVVTWHHFHFKLPRNYVVRDGSIGSVLGKTRTNRETLERSLTEITDSSIAIVLELIAEKSLYRGEEHKRAIETFATTLRNYNAAENKDQFLWVTSLTLGAMCNFRGTVIGTLLVDLSKGVELEEAVRLFESKVAPENYKRSSALITKGMIKAAEEKVASLGLEPALHRRFAVTEDVTVANVLFADRTARQQMGVFDELRAEVPDKAPKSSNIEEITIADFMANVLPKVSKIDLLLENPHANNLVSLVAPAHTDAPPIFKWDNGFSWSYNGEVADSIAEKVKRAGGDVTGDLRCSLAWYNGDDLDIHVKEPNGNHISYQKKTGHASGAALDVDMNAGGPSTREPVENITWPRKGKMQEGQYKLYINNYAKRESIDVGFEVEIEFGGTIYSFHYANAVRSKQNVHVATFEYTRKGGFKIIESIPSTQASKQVWGLATQKYHRVAMLMYSPNHWDGNETGNRHWFFVLEGCANPEPARGFYNEFLRNDLVEHRKVFEVLSSKMKTAPSDRQLSGLGFSSTRRNSVTCRVSGEYNRTLQIKF